jgi:hypothetical protein
MICTVWQIKCQERNSPELPFDFVGSVLIHSPVCDTVDAYRFTKGRVVTISTFSLPARRTALIMNLAAVLTWSLAPPMIHSLTGFFPVNFQNAFRYLVALLVLWPAFLFTEEATLRRKHLSLLR